MIRLFLQDVQNFLRDEDGPTTVEYAVMLMLILMVCITAIQAIGRLTGASFDDSSSKINTAFKK